MKKKYIFAGIAVITAIIFIISAGCASTGGSETRTAPVMVMEDEYPGMTAAAWVDQVNIGWNLGNALDARYRNTTHARENFNPASSAPGFPRTNVPISTLDRFFYNPSPVKAHIDFVKEQGFNAIRIPVTWEKAADPNNNYTIRRDWMARVKEVVDWAVANDMYIIINTHHDEYHYVTDAYGYSEWDQRLHGLFGFRDSEKEQSKVVFKRIWEQIAEAFKDYDYKLVFEALNEPRVKGSNEWGGGIPRERRNVNEFYQVFVDTVRASGGNNAYRILMINPYAASRLPAAVNDLVLPTDTVPNRIIVSFHMYVPTFFALMEASPVITWSRNNPTDTKPIIDGFNFVFDKFARNGIPVVLGEFGTTIKLPEIQDAREREAWEKARAEWTEFHVRYANSLGIKCFYWDDGGNISIFNRNQPGILTVRQQHILDALMRGIQ